MAKDSNNSNSNLNDAEIHQFSKGWTVDLDNHIEQSTGFTDAWNGRLYSKDGTLAFVSVNGTRFVYNNENVLKYNGFYAFEDELIVFGKADIPIEQGETEEQEIIEITVNNFNISTNTNEITNIDFLSNFSEETVIINVPVEPIDDDDFSQNLSDIEESNTIDVTYNGLFKTLTYMPSNPVICQLDTDAPINNQDGINDVIFSFKYNSSGLLIGKIIYVGHLNIPFNAIITTEGVSENVYNKRVYFSDYYNPTRVVNVKDENLLKRNSFEFDIKTKGILLNPRINSINENGQIKAMTVFYAMRLFTENGQQTDFSPLSKGVKITKGNGDEKIGGDISEITNKSVVIDCYIPDYKNFKEVQLIAIEFEAKDVPTSIKLIGTKLVNAIVSFEHFGSESEYSENITLADLFANSISWRYNSDFAVKNNKLIAVGLRNDPLFLNSKGLELDFSLNGFKPTGETHTSLLNSDPVHYNYINLGMTESFVYVKRKLFRKIEVFGNFKMKIENKITGEYYEYEEENVQYNYIDQTSNIFNFLNTTQDDIDFETKFPNLNIIQTSGRILFKPIDENIQTDFYNYILSFSTNQVIVDMDNDIEVKEYSWPSNDSAKDSNLVYGGVSNGWFNGNGVRVTMHTVKENVLSKNTDWMVANNHPLQIKEPSLRKFVMKGEIYRIGIQWFKNGNRLFTTILGDIKIPDIGQKKREVNENGQIIITNETYTNWSVVGNEMYSEGIELQFDVRINCELSKEVDSYQIVYVERTESNRTILAQGISAPLERVLPFTIEEDVNIQFEEIITNKWGIPSNGGPVYDALGFTAYDINPNNVNLFPFPDGPIEGTTATNSSTIFGSNNVPARVITNRKAFYFDSPDLIYSKISDNFISSCVLEYIESIATDHDRYNIIGGYNSETSSPGGTQCYFSNGSKNNSGPVPFGNPKFSQKIPLSLLSGESKEKPFYVNVSVFSNNLKRRTFTSFQQDINPLDVYEIDKTESANDGEVLSAFKMNDSFDYSNNALTLASPGWFFQITARKRYISRFTLFEVNNVAQGRNTVFIKTKENYFKSSNISQSSFVINSQVNFGTSEGRSDSIKGNDSYIVSNLKRNNLESIYGGRSEFAYSANEYIPMSDVIPVITNRISSQVFYVEGDTYCSLYIRNKSSYKDSLVPKEIGFQWSRDASAQDRKFQYNKYNAWCYAVVLESTVEPRLNNSEEFYRFSNAIDFNYDEKFNNAYFQENNLRKSIPKPYNFKDDPILNNIIAVSKTKLNGDSIDAWTQFPTNEFYELDKNKGTAFNVVKEQDEIFVVQEHQTSKIQIDERSFVTPDNDGEAIQIKQGSGTSISGHTIVSNYGTSFRRAIVKSDFGFVFYDERKFEMVKIIEPLFLKNNLSLLIRELFENNKVVDIQGYYDEQFKETNIRFRTIDDVNFVISFNEVLKVFNGKINYDNDLYFVFQEKVLAPYNDSKSIGELNTGDQLKYFEIQNNLKLKVISAPIFFETKINKGIAVYLNTNYPLLKTVFITSLNQIRTVLGTHHWYKIREGVHTLPAKNPEDYDDLRGEWCSIEIEVESIENKEVKVFSLINFFRKSYK